MVQKILVSWIGNTDLRALSRTLDGEKAATILKAAGGPIQKEEKGVGPLRTLLDSGEFDEVHVLTNFDKFVNTEVGLWLGKNVQIHQVKLKNPSDYVEIYSVVEQLLTKIHPPDGQLCFHLSPGTPAMAAIWVLLGKSSYPATLFQTFGGKISVAEIPFDVTVDVLPKLLEKSEQVWQHLVAERPNEVIGFANIIGESKPLRAVVGRASRAALHDVPVLVLGESGTGKELFAEAIHKASHRRDKPFEVVNCAAMPDQLLESELFGHVKGAFTDAKINRDGRFKLAHGGTLFLDEIGECSLEMQAKLLRVLQPAIGAGPCDRIFRRVGDSEDSTADVRIVAATNRDLLQRVRDGSFREDLLYRISTITLKLPPLRERDADVMLLADALLESINDQFQRQHGVNYRRKEISASGKKFLLKRAWPGNVRQLRNVLVQASVMASSHSLEAYDLEASLNDFPGLEASSNLDPPLGNGFDLDDFLLEKRKHFIRLAMTQAGGKVTHAAKLLGMANYQKLNQQMERFGMDLKEE